MTSYRTRLHCRVCDRDMSRPTHELRIDFDPGDPDAVILTKTCDLGHVTEQHLTFTEHRHLIRLLVANDAQTTADPRDIEATLTALDDAAAWLDSPAFDTARAALRLTRGAP